MSAPAPDSALAAARAAWQRGDAAGAEAGCRALLKTHPRHTAGWTLLGIVLRRSDPPAAEAALRNAVEQDPGDPDAAFHLANVLREQHRPHEAIVAYRKALTLRPNHPSVQNNLALAQEAAGEPAAALSAYRAILERHPEHRQALGNLVHLLCRLRRYADASTAAAQYLQHFPEGDARLWGDLGICQHHARDHDRAEASFRHALALDPHDIVAMTNLASLLIDREDFEQASAILDQAVDYGADSAYALSLLAFCRAHLCQWPGIDALHERVRQRIAGGDDSVNAFASLTMPLTAEEQLRAAKRWASDLVPPPGGCDATAPGRAATARLRLGYVSSDFRTHPTAFLLAEVWERHDRSRVETFAYSIGPSETSPLRSRVEHAFDHFRDCAADSVDQTVQRVRADAIDVLIDLNGYTTHARSEIFAARPAAVQMQWLGHLGTLGAEHIDYVLTDRVATPGDQQPFFSERLLFLPHCYCPSDTRRVVAPSTPNRQAQGLPATGFVFCCFNSPYKITAEIFAIWMRLLADVQGSVLWLSPTRPAAGDNLRREAARRDVDPARLVFAPRVPLQDHLARHAHANLFLDTTPYNAGATANDALWMGLPVLTCIGITMAGRVAASQLRAVGLDDMVTTHLADYESRALLLAQRPELLGEVRRRLAENKTTHSLFDMQRLTRDLEDTLERAWRDHASLPDSVASTS